MNADYYLESFVIEFFVEHDFLFMEENGGLTCLGRYLLQMVSS